ncbi:MAG: hypothetical protein AB3N14_20775 [Flavobacteriaceae bacterium]
MRKRFVLLLVAFGFSVILHSESSENEFSDGPYGGDYHNKGSGILLPPELEEKLLEGRPECIIYISKAVSLESVEYEYLYLQLGLWLPNHWDGDWNGEMVVRRKLGEQDWSQCTLFMPSHKIGEIVLRHSIGPISVDDDEFSKYIHELKSNE